MTISISGKHKWTNKFKIRANELVNILMELIEVEHPYPRYYYVPRQNMTDGVAADGGHWFDLRECSDFVLVPLPNPNAFPEDYCRRMWNAVNLHGRTDH